MLPEVEVKSLAAGINRAESDNRLCFPESTQERKNNIGLFFFSCRRHSENEDHNSASLQPENLFSASVFSPTSCLAGFTC